MSVSFGNDLLAGRYELAGALGFGGMAEVYRAWDAVLCRHVAVKLLQPSSDIDDGRRFDNEVRTLAGLSHPNLVSVYDAGTNGRNAFVVLQLIEGDTLRDRISAGPLSVEDVRRLGSRLAEALAYVHDQGVVHRDVKPSNILLDHAGTPYLADFGLAHLTGATRLTRTDQMVGTAAYLAPEQVRGTEVGPAADVYAFGLVLLECLTGRREYPGGDIESAVARLHRPADIPADLPPDLVRLLSLMTSLSARRRPTAHECAQALLTGRLPAALPEPDDSYPQALRKSDDSHEDATDSRQDATSPLAQPSPHRRVSKKALTASVAGLIGAVAISWAASQGTAPGEPAGQPVTQTTTSSPSPAEQPSGSASTPTDAVTGSVAVEQQPVAPVVQPEPAPQQQAQQQVQQQVREQPPGQVKQDKVEKPKSQGEAKKNKP